MSDADQISIEIRRRINVAAWAYAYEIENDPIVDDVTFDREAALVRPEVSTGHAVVDEFFRSEFSPHTGMWVRRHPEKHLLPRICALKRRVAAARKAAPIAKPAPEPAPAPAGDLFALMGVDLAQSSRLNASRHV